MNGVAPHYDVFVSYTALAGQARSNNPDPWPANLVDRLLTEIATIEPGATTIDQVYVYETRPRGEEWREHVAASCRATVLLPVVSETYFQSETCFLEWYAFVTGNPDFGQYRPIPPHRFNIVPVWRLERENWQRIEASLRSEMTAFALEHIPTTVGRTWRVPEDDLVALVRGWVDSIFDRNGENLSEHFEAGRGQFARGDLQKSIAVLARSIVPLLSKAVSRGALSDKAAKLVNLSVLALGLDRFSEGGWGFSMGPEFERDSSGRLFPQGRDELNQLVLRSLRSVIPERRLVAETKDALLWSLADGLPSGLAQSRVKDRKQRAMALSSLLHSRDIREIRDQLITHKKHLAQEVGHSPFDQRWVVETPFPTREAEGFSDVAFFDFAARARAAIEDGGLAEGLGLDRSEVDRNYATADKSLREWLHRNDIFLILKAGFFDLLDDEPSDTKVHRLAQRDREPPPRKPTHTVMMMALHFAMLATIAESAEMLGVLPGTLRGVRSIEPQIERIAARLKREDASSKDLSAFFSVYPLYCLALSDIAHHYSESDAITRHAAACRRHWLDIIECLGPAKVGRSMNAAGWAASIILAERYGELSDAGVLEQIWSQAAILRGLRRKEAIDAVSLPRADARSKFDAFVLDEIEALQTKFGPEAFGLAGEDAAVLRPLFSFGGNGAGWRPEVNQRVGDAVGLLMVDAETDRILSATVGFNSIYIEPFSARLGIGLNSLERLVFELGETDAKFIVSLSESVVERCWPLDDLDGPDLEAATFAERSNYVSNGVRQQQLTNRNDPGISFRDLLQLRLGADGQSRYVLRTCSLVHPKDLVGVAPALTGDESDTAGILLWTFVDVSRWIDSGVLQFGRHLVRAG